MIQLAYVVNKDNRKGTQCFLLEVIFTDFMIRTHRKKYPIAAIGVPAIGVLNYIGLIFKSFKISIS